VILKTLQEDQVISELAHHCYRANDPRAGKYLLMAGDKARETYSNQEAIRAYRNALEFMPDDEKPNVMEKLGDVLSLIGNYEQALGIFEKAHDSVPEPIFKARMLRKMGEIHQSIGEPDVSLDFLERARIITDAKGPEHAKILFAKGCAQHKKGEHETALSLIEESLKYFEMAGDRKAIAEALRYIGSIHWNNSDYQNAMIYYERSMDIMVRLKDENGIASALGNMGIVHWNRGNLDDALDCYARSLKIAEKVGNKAGTGAILTNMGLVFWDKGELDRSLDFQSRSLRIFEKIGNHNGIATVLGNISLVHRDNGDLDLALEHQKLSLGMRERMGDQAGIALALQNLGETQFDIGEFDTAMEHYKRSLSICQEIGDRRVSIHNLCGMAEVSLCLGENAAAKEYSRKGVEISDCIGARFEQALSHRMLGITHRNAGELDDASKEFSMAESILKEIKDKKELAKLDLEKGILHRLNGRNDESRNSIENARAEFERMGMRPYIERCKKELSLLNSK
jgi:tetratricopeptide (TPR) repeat protein